MKLQERLKTYLNLKGLTFRDFENICNLSNGTAARLRPTTRISTFNRIANSCDLNINWLLTGEGDMLTQKNMHEIEISVDDKPKAASRLIPLYDAETTGGFGGLVSSSNADVSLMGYVQAGSWFDGRETAAIRHTGNSMVEYPDGCVLAVREVTDRHLLVPGRNYVIETSEYRITKRVQKGSSPDTIALYSTNQEKYENGRLVHEPFEVDIADIRRIFSVLGYIVNQSGEYRLIKP